MSDDQSFPQQLAKIQSNMGQLARLQPKAMSAFNALHQAGTADAALDAKTKELIALAIAVTVRCDGCIAFHTHDVLKAGASRDEIADALGVAIMMGGGPSVVYATYVMEAVEQFSQADA